MCGAKAQEITLRVFFCCPSLPIVDFGWLPASTLADTIRREQTILGNPRGVVFEIIGKIGSWGMILHSNCLLSAVAHASGRFQRRAGKFIGFGHSIVAQMSDARKRWIVTGGPTP